MCPYVCQCPYAKRCPYNHTFTSRQDDGVSRNLYESMYTEILHFRSNCLHHPCLQVHQLKQRHCHEDLLSNSLPKIFFGTAGRCSDDLWIVRARGPPAPGGFGTAGLG